MVPTAIYLLCLSGPWPTRVPFTSMLSSTARPKLSGPVSWPSSNTIWMFWTLPVTGPDPPKGVLPQPLDDAQKPTTDPAPPVPQRRRSQPAPGVWVVGGGELQPMKNDPAVVSTLKRGAPAPQ